MPTGKTQRAAGVPPESEAAAVDIFDAMQCFCQTFGKKCYGAYSPEVLRDYLDFHMEQNTFCWVRKDNVIAGCGVAWQCNEAEIRALQGRNCFTWQPTNPEGDSLFLADFVATMPGALPAILLWFSKRFPEFNKLKWFTYRRGRLVQITRRECVKILKLHRGKKS